MILSNSSIHEALEKGWLAIDPEPFPRHNSIGAVKSPYQTSPVDLRLGSEIAFLKSKMPVNIDLRKGDFSGIFAANSETCAITEEQPFVLKPSRYWEKRWNG